MSPSNGITVAEGYEKSNMTRPPPLTERQRDTYTGHLTVKQMNSNPDSPQTGQGRQRAAKLYHSQNVRGFKKRDQHKWMRVWKQKGKRHEAIFWGLQETKINSERAALLAADAWRAIWGVQ